MHQQLLEQAGLTKGEAAVYIALLQQGSSTVGPIVNKSRVAYSNIYTILERLIEKGLASFVIKAKTKYYQAVEPHRLLDYIDKQQQQLAEQKNALQHALPELKQLQALVGKRQEAEIFIGWKGIKTAYEKILDEYKPDDIYRFFYAYSKHHSSNVDLFFNQFHDTYIKRKIVFQGISRKEYKKSWYVKKAKLYTKMRYVNFPLPSNIEIVGDVVILTSWVNPPISFYIHSKEIAEDLRKYFDTVWKQAKP